MAIAIDAIELDCGEFRFDTGLIEGIIGSPTVYLEAALLTPPARVRYIAVVEQETMREIEKESSQREKQNDHNHQAGNGRSTSGFGMHTYKIKRNADAEEALQCKNKSLPHVRSLPRSKNTQTFHKS